MPRNNGRDEIGRRILAAAGAIPAIVPKRFIVCRQGHVMTVAENAIPVMGFSNGDGSVQQAVLCPRCQFEFFAATFGAELCEPNVTEHEAGWKARKLRREALAEIEMPCCPKGLGHEGDCAPIPPPPETVA